MHQFSRFAMAIPFLWSNKSKILVVVLGSLVIHTMIFLIMDLASISLSQHLSFMYFITFGPTIAFISMLPISISGLGVRESAFVYFFSFVGVRSEVAFSISILSFLVLISPSLIGAYFYFRQGIGIDYIRGMTEAGSSTASNKNASQCES